MHRFKMRGSSKVTKIFICFKEAATVLSNSKNEITCLPILSLAMAFLVDPNDIQ